MASSMSREQRERMRREAERLRARENIRRDPPQDLKDLFKKSDRQQADRRLQQEMKDFLNNRPNWPGRDRSPIPRIPQTQLPRQLDRKLRERALELAKRVAKRTIPVVRFSQLLQDLLEWLVNWIFERFGWRARHSGWRQTSACAMPLPAVGPDKYLTGDLAFLSCTTGQVVGAGAPNTLAEITAGASLFAARMLQHNALPRYQIVQTWTRMRIPWQWELPDMDNPPDNWLPDRLWEPPPNIRPHLRPDFRERMQDRLPDRDKDKENNTDRAPDKPGDRPESDKGYSDEIEITPAPNQNTKVVMRRYQRSRTNTRSREKEGKFQGSSETTQELFRRLSVLKEGFTEYDDFLDNIIDAMPKDIRSKLPKRNGRETPDLKARFIYDNWEHVDMYELAENLVTNWIEDKAIGTLIDLSDKAAKARGTTNTTASRWWLHKAR